MSRLYSKKMVSTIELNEVKMKLLEQKIDYEKNKVTAAALMKGIQALTTY
jgi:hypothetical protein